MTLYHGDAMQLLPLLRADAIVTDPPYGETSLEWDRWPDGWPALAAQCAPQMWCFGSFRMFMDKSSEFSGWKLAQDVIWEKHNGSNAFADRFRRLHELAVHFYQGEWSSLHITPQFTNDATARTVRRKRRPPQWGHIEASSYRSEDGGPRLMSSVIYAAKLPRSRGTPNAEAGGDRAAAHGVQRATRRRSARLLRWQRHGAASRA